MRLAAVSGRPVIAVALASSRRIDLNTWDGAALNLPFSRIALVGGPPNQVPSNADAATIEQYRLKLEADLNSSDQSCLCARRGFMSDTPASLAFPRAGHSITSSAWASSKCGTSRPTPWRSRD